MAQSQPVVETHSTLILLNEKGQRTEFARTAAVDSGNQLENKRATEQNADRVSTNNLTERQPAQCKPSPQEQFD